MNHKSAWAEENRAPAKGGGGERPARRRIVASPSLSSNSSSNRVINRKDVPIDILIVASKLKKYVKEAHDLNTSGNVMDKLSEIVRNLCDDAVERARSEGRKTLMDRDF